MKMIERDRDTTGDGKDFPILLERLSVAGSSLWAGSGMVTVIGSSSGVSVVSVVGLLI